MLGNIDIHKIHKRFTYTKSMVDLVKVPNVTYNQGLQGLLQLSVCFDRTAICAFCPHCVSCAARPWVSLGLPGYLWASPGIPLGLPGVPWGSLGVPGAPWASLCLPGAAEGPPWGRRGACRSATRGHTHSCIDEAGVSARVNVLAHDFARVPQPGNLNHVFIFF